MIDQNEKRRGNGEEWGHCTWVKRQRDGETYERGSGNTKIRRLNPKPNNKRQEAKKNRKMRVQAWLGLGIL